MYVYRSNSEVGVEIDGIKGLNLVPFKEPPTGTIWSITSI